MSSSAQEAVNKVFYAALNNKPLWANRVQPLEQATSTLAKPCVLFFPASNLRVPVSIRKKNYELIMRVKGVATDVATAFAIQDAISELLDDSGRQDFNPRLPINADWDITTVSAMQAIWLQENFSQDTTYYHAGHDYRVTVERKY